MSRRFLKSISIINVVCFVAVFLMPWQARWIYSYVTIAEQTYEYGALSIYAGSIFVILAVAALWSRVRFDRALRLSLFVTLAWFVLTSVISLKGSVALYYLSLIVIAFGYYVIAVHWDRKKIIVTLIASAVVQTVIAWQQLLNQFISPSSFLGVAEHSPRVLGQSVVIIHGGRFLRSYGLLPHPNVLGGFLVIAFVLLLYLFIRHSQKRWDDFTIQHWTVYIGVGLFLLSGILITFSRAALLGAALFLVGWLIYALIKKQKRILISAGQILSASVALFLVFNIITSGVWLQRVGLSERFVSVAPQQQRLEQISSQERLSGMREAVSLVNVRSVTLGYGLGNYVPTLARAFPGQPTYAYQPVHVVYIMIVLEIGLVGAALLIWLLVSILRESWQRFGHDFVYLYFFSVFALLLFLGLFDHYLWTSYFGLSLCWLTVGLAAKENN